VNARARVVSCTAGSAVVVAPPVDVGDPTVTYQYAFSLAPGVWPAGWVDDPAAPEGAVGVRVKASVAIGPGYTDPGFAEAACSP
jgi:hypothetical protein